MGVSKVSVLYIYIDYSNSVSPVRVARATPWVRKFKIEFIFVISNHVFNFRIII